MDEMGDLNTDRTNVCFATVQAEGEGRSPVGLACLPGCLLLAVPGRYFCCRTFC